MTDDEKLERYREWAQRSPGSWENEIIALLIQKQRALEARLQETSLALVNELSGLSAKVGFLAGITETKVAALEHYVGSNDVNFSYTAWPEDRE